MSAHSQCREATVAQGELRPLPAATFGRPSLCILRQSVPSLDPRSILGPSHCLCSALRARSWQAGGVWACGGCGPRTFQEGVSRHPVSRSCSSAL